MAFKLFKSVPSQPKKSLNDYVEIRIGRYEPVVDVEGEGRFITVLNVVSLEDSQTITEALYRGDIVVLNIEPLMRKDKLELKKLIDDIKEVCSSIGGSLVGIAETRLLITPPGIRIRKESS